MRGVGKWLIKILRKVKNILYLYIKIVDFTKVGPEIPALFDDVSNLDTQNLSLVDATKREILGLYSSILIVAIPVHNFPPTAITKTTDVELFNNFAS